MYNKKCEICKEEFEGDLKSRKCDDCKYELSQMSNEFPYKERVKMLKTKYKEEREKKKLSINDMLLLFCCSRCLWCRKMDVKNRKIFCSLPRCERLTKENIKEDKDGTIRV